jgi:hypothetical protein
MAPQAGSTPPCKRVSLVIAARFPVPLFYSDRPWAPPLTPTPRPLFHLLPSLTVKPRWVPPQSFLWSIDLALTPSYTPRSCGTRSQPPEFTGAPLPLRDRCRSNRVTGFTPSRLVHELPLPLHCPALFLRFPGSVAATVASSSRLGRWVSRPAVFFLISFPI